MKRFSRAISLVALLGASSVALAAGGGGDHGAHHGIDPKTLAFQLVNFGVLLFILIKFAGGALNKGLKARHEQLKADLEDANRLRTAAEARAKEQESRLANLEKEIANMRAAITAEAESEKQRLLSAAEEKARRIQADTKFQLEQQVKEAQLRLRNEVAAASIKVAEELLRRGVTPQDEQRLLQTFIAELGTSNGPRMSGPDGHGSSGQPERSGTRPTPPA
jgi:F-type H+-transporting ATPase subunit b